eukprot:3361719-Alexandrium_andersonii.AAC.1
MVALGAVTGNVDPRVGWRCRTGESNGQVVKCSSSEGGVLQIRHWQFQLGVCRLGVVGWGSLCLRSCSVLMVNVKMRSARVPRDR